MPSTHVSLYYHLVFSTKRRRPWINESWEERLHNYLGGLVRGFDGVAEAVGGGLDHVHIAASLKATHCPADFTREIKSRSSRWIHEEIGNRLFGWQEGYGLFTVGRSQIDGLRQYIRRQKEHHRRKTFQEEYIELLRESGVEFDERFLW